jgi:hypothetical protein
MPEAEFGDVQQKRLGSAQSQYTAQMIVDDKTVVINTREYDFFIPAAAEEFDLVLDVQYNPDRNWPENVQPFTMFAQRMTEFHTKLPAYRDVIQQGTKRYKVGWSGCVWSKRRRMLDALGKYPWMFIRDNWTNNHRAGEGPNRRQFIGLSYDEYVSEVSSWLWGLVLYGRGSNRKGAGNQREHEFSALGIPMILNYQPCYYEPMVPGKHFMYARAAHKVVDMLNETSEEYAKEIAHEAYQYWKLTMSPEGICSLFKRICRERL